jgi:MFS family permease
MYSIFIIESIFMILMLVFEVPWGYIADRFGYKITLVISNLLMFISKIVFFEAHSFGLFLFERILLAIAFAGISGCDIALLYSSIDKEKSEKIFGIYTAISSLGFLFACLLSTFMVMKSLDSTAFITIIPFAVAAALTFFIKDVKYSKTDNITFKNSLKSLSNNKQIFILVLAAALFSEISHSVTVFLNQPQYLRSGINLSFFGAITALVQVAAISSTKTHSITKRFGQPRIMKTLLIVLTLSCLFLIFTTSPLLSIIFIILAGGSLSIAQPTILDIQNKSIITNNRATMLSIYAMAGDILSAIVNPIIGKSADISLQAAFITCTAFSFLALVLVIIFFKKPAIDTNSTIAHLSF